MKLRKKCLAYLMALTMVLPMGLTGCGKSDKDSKSEDTTATTTEKASDVDATSEDATSEDANSNGDATETENFVELALNVFYNDADHNYYDNEAGESIVVTDNGQYTLTFDCSKDLSESATSAGVNSLTNLTAVYILDMGSTKDQQSPISACNIKYDSVVVDGTELTITKTDVKSAIKGTGIFDTNDPINGWDGSAVEEVESTADHVTNFTTVKNPTTISVTFTLSDIAWGGASTGNSDGEAGTLPANTYVNSAKFSDMDLSGTTSVELTELLGNGINLGNTMDATNAGLGKKADVSAYETAWGQPLTTKEMIMGMKNSGFDTLRIPVSWANTIDFENGNYEINSAYVDRVQQIVDWGLEAEMFVVLNAHHDSGMTGTGIWQYFASKDQAEVDMAWAVYENIWKTISERFKDYPDMLIFESANEELGSGWISFGMKEDECYTTMNAINQKFVDIVRASGGNNDDRFLLIAGNNTDIDKTIDDRYVVPTDTATNKLLVSVHYYSPTNYCLDKKSENPEDAETYRWGLKNEYESMKEQLEKVNKFVDAGYGVIIGEYGALPLYVNGEHYEIAHAIEYTNAFLNVCDVNGFCPILWDTNGTYSKSDCRLRTDGMLELYTGRCYAEQTDGYKQASSDDFDKCMSEAPEAWEGQETYAPGTPVAWIMWNGGAGTYSVGDKFNAADNTPGITATNTVIEGAGEYTVSLDFDGGNNSLVFGALAIADGELLFPGAIINIKEVTLDGTPVELGKYYTCSDDKKCTRVNLFNQWCGDLQTQVAKEDCNFRTMDGDLSDITAMPLDSTLFTGQKNITITFEVVLPE